MQLDLEHLRSSKLLQARLEATFASYSSEDMSENPSRWWRQVIQWAQQAAVELYLDRQRRQLTG